MVVSLREFVLHFLVDGLGLRQADRLHRLIKWVPSAHVGTQDLLLTLERSRDACDEALLIQGELFGLFLERHP